MDAAAKYGIQSPWLGNIDGAGFALNNAAAVSITAVAAVPLQVRGLALGAIAGDIREWASFYGITSNTEDLRISHKRITAGSDWSTADIRLQKFVDGSSMNFMAFRGGVGTVFGQGNTDQVLFADSGRVQIGTNLGGTTGVLDLYRATGVDNLLRIHAGNVYDCRLGMTSTNDGVLVWSAVAANVYVGCDAAASLHLITSGAIRVTIDSSGKITMGSNVGINCPPESGTILAINAGVDGSGTNAIHLHGSQISSFGYLRADHVAGEITVGFWTGGGSGKVNLIGPIRCQDLAGANPGAGSKQLWFDPADGNRVKFAA
jgi:hypothetical protein